MENQTETKISPLKTVVSRAYLPEHNSYEEILECGHSFGVFISPETGKEVHTTLANRKADRRRCMYCKLPTTSLRVSGGF
jgi:hypothetical protein